MGKTKKVGSAGRFGARYGLRIRKNVISVEDVGRRHKCPECLKAGVVRMFSGAWKCEKCGIKFTGKAYKP